MRRRKVKEGEEGWRKSDSKVGINSGKKKKKKKKKKKRKSEKGGEELEGE